MMDICEGRLIDGRSPLTAIGIPPGQMTISREIQPGDTLDRAQFAEVHYRITRRLLTRHKKQVGSRLAAEAGFPKDGEEWPSVGGWNNGEGESKRMICGGRFHRGAATRVPSRM